MKYLLPIWFSLPTALWCIAILFGIFFGPFQANNPTEFPSLPSNASAFLVILPIVGFAACVAMTFVKQGAREWRYAAIFNGIPIGLIFILFGFFELIGYNG